MARGLHLLLKLRGCPESAKGAMKPGGAKGGAKGGEGGQGEGPDLGQAVLCLADALGKGPVAFEAPLSWGGEYRGKVRGLLAVEFVGADTGEGENNAS